MDNKTVLEGISSDTNMKPDDVRKMLQSFCGIVADIAIDGDTLIIPSFGQFEPRKRGERIASHPSSGRRLLVPPKLSLAFKPSAILKSAINDVPMQNNSDK